ncbi:MAG: hypothetical protein J2P54_11705, partial [Bradyrhizobiaceae bacterium]|nr:hypothetical protein [Bradyrhizobiaceae bacterium]
FDPPPRADRDQGDDVLFCWTTVTSRACLVTWPTHGHPVNNAHPRTSLARFQFAIVSQQMEKNE